MKKSPNPMTGDLEGKPMIVEGKSLMKNLPTQKEF